MKIDKNKTIINIDVIAVDTLESHTIIIQLK